MTLPHYVKEGNVKRRARLIDKVKYVILILTNQIKEI